MQKFSCPDCKCTRLEVCQSNAVITQEITIFDDESVDYGNAQVSDSTIDRFQCFNCGWKIPGVTDDDELIQWLKKQEGIRNENL